MSRAKVLLLLAFLLVFAAGAVVGMVREPRGVAQRIEPQHGPFASLNLTPAQREQMKAIWSPVEELHHEMGRRWPQIRQERDQAIAELLTPEQKSRYDQIQQDFGRRTHEMDAQVQQAIHEAEEKTRQILTPEQQTKFEQIRKEHAQRPHGMRRSRSANTSTTAPTTER